MFRNLSVAILFAACSPPEAPVAASDDAGLARVGTCADVGGTWSGVVFTDLQADHTVDFVDRATSAELQTVPGVGSSIAQRIIDGRPYLSAADPIAKLDAVSYVSATVLTSLRDTTDARWCSLDDGRQACCEDAPAPVEVGTGRAGHDVNGDGFDDLLVGAPGYQVHGAAYVFKGGATLDGTADLPAYGSGASSARDYGFGQSVAVAGDLNGDGFDDFAVAIPSRVGLTGQLGGKVNVYFGGAALDRTVDVTLAQGGAADRFGAKVAPAGDVNGDGYDDLVVSASGTRKAYVFFGGAAMDAQPDAVLTGTATTFAVSVAGAGDVNDDGFDDVLVAAPGSESPLVAGAVYVFHGKAGAFDTAVDTTLVGASWGFGEDVSPAGDVNADGYADVLVGSPRESTATGAVHLFLGRAGGLATTSVKLTGARTGDQLGRVVTNLGDVNGDGFHDVAAGAPYRDSNGTSSGGVFVWYGGATFDRYADKLINGGVAGRTFGWSVSGADVNGDGLGDLVVGASEEGLGRKGRTYVYKGGTTGLSGSVGVTMYGPWDGAAFADDVN